LTRTFAAIFPPPEVRERISELSAELKKVAGDVKWVETQNVHLTLRFFGSLTDAQLECAAESMRETAREANAFKVRLAAVGAFPSISRPRVIWVGIEEGRELTMRVAEALERRFVEAGLGGADRPCSPHLTIGRVKVPRRNPRLEEAIRTLTFEGAEFMINALTLTKSELRRGGPIYSPVVVAKLGVAEQ
jgi:2'-5' RNA ligase